MVVTDYMALAIEQARRGGAATYTNPQVGAVLVKAGHVLATGYHHHFGGDHAEVDVLKQVSAQAAQGATLYVTLEPCSHYGKTPPCCQQVVAAGIKQVVIGQLDPHPIVAGRGRDYLVTHGVQVTISRSQDRVMALNPHYNFFYRLKRPWITLKAAITLDGKLTAVPGKRSLVSNQLSYVDSQQLRSHFQAILIGEQTLKIDNPALTVRLVTMEHPPVRIILLQDSSAAIGKRILQASDAPIWLLCRQPSPTDSQLAALPQVQVLVGTWTPAKISTLCAEHGVQSLLVEGGSRVQARFVAAELVDEVLLYIAPKIYGGQGLPLISGERALKPLQFGAPSVVALGDDLKLVFKRKVDASCLQESCKPKAR